jgi:hypothetical protein
VRAALDEVPGGAEPDDARADDDGVQPAAESGE